ncbi:MAG: DUF411 domain-containing protein [Halocynthiibacter sp.]
MLRKTLSLIAFAALPSTAAIAQTEEVVIDVAKNAGCMCCDGWVNRMDDAGFALQPRNIPGEKLYDLKVERGMSSDLWACHTATVAGYTIEGHVPARELRRLLSERPDAIGLATPGMPVGSPGMDTIGAPNMGFSEGQKEAYDVILVLRDGSTGIFASYEGD